MNAQPNNVKTASFDVKNRVLTLPIFKEKSGDVYDMLIAHECAHALYTPYEQWEGINDKELRSYVNVIEDTRIDKLIQSKYPGVVKNYMNGFDILEKQNFFGIGGKDTNKDFNWYGPISAVNPLYKSNNSLDDEAPKKAMTDALTKAMSHLGMSADIFLGKFDGNKYVQTKTQENDI